MDLLIDTNVLIDHLRGIPGATTFLRDARKQGTLWVSAITVAEIHAGRRMSQSKERMKVIRFMKLFRVAYLDGTVAARGGRIVRDHGTALPDALIAATALEKGLHLVTRNARHFKAIPDLTVRAPY